LDKGPAVTAQGDADHGLAHAARGPGPDFQNQLAALEHLALQGLQAPQAVEQGRDAVVDRDRLLVTAGAAIVQRLKFGRRARNVG
jgi:hypothetical protein